MTKKLDISIVIPVYNSEKYLKRAAESVVSSLGKIDGEILLVENNSTDKSLDVIQELIKTYKGKISVLHYSTPGASPSRNLGMKKARGEYVWFIDADDTITPDAIPKLLTKARQEKADIVMFGAERIYENGHKDYLSPVDESMKNYKSRFVRYGMGPWQILIRRKWWQEYGFSFKEGIIHEDMELMSALILYTDRYTSIDEPLYSYYQTSESVLHKKKFNPHVFDIFPALEGLYQRFEKAGAEKAYHAELEWFFIWNLLIDSAKDFSRFKEGRSGFTRSREMLKKYFPNWRRNKFLRQKPLKLQIYVRMNYKKK
ncbi:glycosyltransferase [Candidatus Saccharibacteria bacterium]|nr:glycosyltransferase [Candidatus Saccharibacteria bacterium]